MKPLLCWLLGHLYSLPDHGSTILYTCRRCGAHGTGASNGVDRFSHPSRRQP